MDLENSQTPLNCNFYTDGSKLRGQVGSGVCIIREGNNIASHKVRLPDHASVYQAEMMAIQQAAIILANIPDLTTIKFYDDSQAALQTFQADFIRSKLAFQTIQALNKVKHEGVMVFVWTKAHIGTAGNEEADKLAKTGTTLPDITYTPTPTSMTGNIVEQCVRKLWQKEWDSYTETRQSKIFIEKIDKDKSKLTIQ